MDYAGTARRIVFTWFGNEGRFDLPEDWFRKVKKGDNGIVRYVTFQVEIAPTTGRQHWQGYAQFTGAIGPRQAKGVLRLPNAWMQKESENSSAEQAIAYCRPGYKKKGEILSKGEKGETLGFYEFGQRARDRCIRKTLKNEVLDENDSGFETQSQRSEIVETDESDTESSTVIQGPIIRRKREGVCKHFMLLASWFSERNGILPRWHNSRNWQKAELVRELLGCESCSAGEFIEIKGFEIDITRRYKWEVKDYEKGSIRIQFLKD